MNGSINISKVGTNSLLFTPNKPPFLLNATTHIEDSKRSTEDDQRSGPRIKWRYDSGSEEAASYFIILCVFK